MKNLSSISCAIATTIGLIFATNTKSHAQTSACTFVSPAVELNYTNTDVSGDCIVNVDLSFTININNGNKYTVLHLWSDSQYPSPSFPYAVSNAPESSQNGGNGALDNALATIIVDRNSTPATLVSSYAPDPSIDDNTLPCINQVKDASDGLILKVTDVGNGNYFYQIQNLTLLYPGGCNQPIKFKGDAWSSNAASLNVQCTMVGFTYLSNIPTLTAIQNCERNGNPAQYQFTVSTDLPDYSVDYSVDIYADVDSSGDFNPFIDNVQIASFPSASLQDVTSSQSYTSPLTDFSWSTEDNNNPLFFILGSIKVTNTVNSTTTSYSNTIISTTVPDCTTPLPLDNVRLSGMREGNWIRLYWSVPTDETIYAVEKMAADGTTWKQIGIEKNKEVGSSSETENYAFTDMEPATSLYRLRAINPDGAYAYSNTVKLEGNHASMDLHIFPNPAPAGQIKMVADLPANQTADITVVNPLGQVIRSYKGVSGSAISIDNLSSGIYYVYMSSANQEKVIKTFAVK